MAEYSKGQLKGLKDRWIRGLKELRLLIPIIKADEYWYLSREYKDLMEALRPLPGGVEKVSQDLRGVSLRKEDLSGAKLMFADLSGSYLVGAKLPGAYLSEADLSGAILMKAKLPGAILVGAKLSGTDLAGAKLPGADLRVANLSNSKSWVGVRWNPKHRVWPRIKRFDFRGKKLKPSERKTVFGNNDIRNANWAGAALLKRYVEDENFLAEYVKRPGWRHKAVSWLWKWTCDYGRSFGRWAVMSLVLALFFGGLYATHPTWFQQEMGPLSPWYFSVVTFTTLGFGDLTPKPECWQAQAWVMVEVILGYIMLGGLISIFANKLARRA